MDLTHLHLLQASDLKNPFYTAVWRGFTFFTPKFAPKNKPLQASKVAKEGSPEKSYANNMVKLKTENGFAKKSLAAGATYCE